MAQHAPSSHDDETSSAAPPPRCLICRDTVAQWFTVPCAHFIACDACLQQLIKTRQFERCALCRTNCTGYVHRATRAEYSVADLLQRQRKRQRRDLPGPDDPMDSDEEQLLNEVLRAAQRGDEDYNPEDDDDEDDGSDASSSSCDDASDCEGSPSDDDVEFGDDDDLPSVSVVPSEPPSTTGPCAMDEST
jgi:hypothetical protein